jgi:hypothetical protein
MSRIVNRRANPASAVDGTHRGLQDLRHSRSSCRQFVIRDLTPEPASTDVTIDDYQVVMKGVGIADLGHPIKRRLEDQVR